MNASASIMLNVIAFFHILLSVPIPDAAVRFKASLMHKANQSYSIPAYLNTDLLNFLRRTVAKVFELTSFKSRSYKCEIYSLRKYWCGYGTQTQTHVFRRAWPC